MMRQLYAMPLPMVAVLMLAILLLWTALCQHFKGRIRTFSNVVLACAATIIILHATLLSRTPGTYAAVLTPFAALAARGSSRSFTGRC